MIIKVITIVGARLNKYLHAYIVLKILYTEYITYLEGSTSILQPVCICHTEVLQI
jgi:hypothetical protein